MTQMPSGLPTRPERIACLVDAPIVKGDYVLYWMQKAQRVAFNPALETAAFLAGELLLPLVVLFVLTEYPSAAANHYRFMLDGLAETAEEIGARGGIFALRSGNPPVVVAEVAANAAVLVGDAPRLAVERSWRRDLAGILAGREAGCPYYQIETEAVVPPLFASPKEEWSARTLRLKLTKLIPDFLIESPMKDWHISISDTISVDCLLPPTGGRSEKELWHSFSDPANPANPENLVRPGDRIAEQRIDISPGYCAALGQIDTFLEDDGLSHYDSRRNDPSTDIQSGLSPYLHFGQISPVDIALQVLDSIELGRDNHSLKLASCLPGLPVRSPGAAAFLEQLIIRRELAVNFALYNPDCTRFETAVPEWARKTLSATRNERMNLFSKEELETAATDDPYWNAAQNQMVLTGKMHNYMRMYWGKRLLTWRKDPAEAFSLLVELNDRYSLDGRDPNGYAGMAWCFGRHDRPWPSHPGFGTVRMMSAAGLERKFDMDSYTSAITLLYTERKKKP